MFKLPSPVHRVDGLPIDFHLDVKREDLIHPLIKGNKFRKLKYNLEALSNNNCNGIITFGGAYSNHLHATAALGKLHSLPTVGIVRGEEINDNPILSDCKNFGMVLHHVSRLAYKEKENHTDIAKIIDQYPNLMLIPEGGSNTLAIKGVIELVDEISEIYDFIAVAAGTGLTAAGIIKRIDELSLSTKVLVFCALKGDWMKDEITRILGYEPIKHFITDAYCQGGYAKTTASYLDQLFTVRTSTDLPIDHVYNGKLLLGLLDMSHNGKIKANDKVLWINSGGVIKI